MKSAITPRIPTGSAERCSRLAAAGVDVRTVAALLGHSDASLVLRVYADALPEAKAAAMGRVDEVMGA